MQVLHGSDYFLPDTFPIMVVQMPYVDLGYEKPHAHDYSELTLILKGECIHCCNGTSVKLSKEDMILVHPGSVHYFDSPKGLEAITLLYDAQVPFAPVATGDFSLLQVLYPSKEASKRNEANPIGKFPECDFTMIISILLRLRYELRRQRLGRKFLVSALFTEAIVYLSRGYSEITESNNSWMLHDVITYMNNNYMNKITVDTLCHIANMSERTLYRCFQESFMTSPCDYLIKIRIMHAIDMLKDKRLTISEIALRCGFCDSNHFSKIFKQQFGNSPKHYRQ